MSVRRIIGAALLVVSLGVGAVVAQRVAATAREAARLEGEKRTQKALSDAMEAVRALPTTLMSTAVSAAEVPGLVSMIRGDADAATFADFLQKEEGWAPFRPQANTGLFFTDTLVAFSGDEAAVRAAAGVAHEAQARKTAAALVVHAGGPWLVAAAKSAETANGQHASVALARAVTPADLEPLTNTLSIALSLSTPEGKAIIGGRDALRPLLEDATSRALGEVVPGLALQVATDLSALRAAADQEANAQRFWVWGAAGVLALVGLLLAAWPTPAPPVQDQLLRQTTEALVRSQEELMKLSQRLTVTGGVAPAGPAVTTDPALGSTVTSQKSSRYDILSQLGEGGMARVYLAVVRGAEGFQRTVVIKRLRPELTGNEEAVNQFIDEARLGASLLHSNIIPVLDFGRDVDGYYLAQEYVLGRNVDRLIEASMNRLGGPPPLPVVLYLASEALKALAYAHTLTNDRGEPMGLVHRDVSPANLMVSERGEVKLLDFGIVKSQERLTKTQAGMVKGNLFFMSPEQARGLVVDQRSDVYSLGLVLLTALRGTTLYTGSNNYELLNRAAAGMTAEDLAVIRQLPLAAVLEKALNLDPTQRYASAEAFGVAIASAGQAATTAEVAALMKKLFGDELAHETTSLRQARSGG